jgi:hypothetical protein
MVSIKMFTSTLLKIILAIIAVGIVIAVIFLDPSNKM